MKTTLNTVAAQAAREAVLKAAAVAMAEAAWAEPTWADTERARAANAAWWAAVEAEEGLK
jgi:molybdopterin-guanine dinucleotide biosynthesis protein